MINWKEVVKTIFDSPEIQAYFINTLSLLEYMGARKMMKALESHQVDPEILVHLAEEIRHASLLKKLALQLSSSLTTYAPEKLFCGKEAVSYFQNVDDGVAALLGQRKTVLNYLCTTWIIEERAQELYRFLDDLCQARPHPKVFRQILKDEQAHLLSTDHQIESLEESGVIHRSIRSQVKQLEADEFSLFVRHLDCNLTKEWNVQSLKLSWVLS